MSNQAFRIFPQSRAILAALVLGALQTGIAVAQDGDLGKQLYTEACAICHGASGKGDGEFGTHLNVKPTDLTKIASAESDGEFPYLGVFMVVDGRTGVRGHGSKDMPIWGKVFARDIGESGGPYGAELLIRARLVALVDYLESMQAP